MNNDIKYLQSENYLLRKKIREKNELLKKYYRKIRHLELELYCDKCSNKQVSIYEIEKLT